MDSEATTVLNEDDSATTNNKPLASFKRGSISAAVFSRELSTKSGDLFMKYSVGIDRSYKDAKGVWQNSETLWLQENDLYRGALCLLESLDEIRKLKREDKSVE